MSTKLTGYVWDGCAASGMKLSSVAIMARLADFSNDEGVCWPSIETIARQIGAGMSTVRTAIARLEAEGWLTRKARRQGNHTTAYRDGAGIWTICRGATMVDGKPVIPGMKLSKEKCNQVNAIERDKALAWVEKNIRVSLTEPQKAGIASFCPYNIGPGKCFPSTFYKRLNAGDRKGACEAIRWWIKDGGRDCRIRSNNCYGQVIRRDQESALACWGIDQ